MSTTCLPYRSYGVTDLCTDTIDLYYTLPLVLFVVVECVANLLKLDVYQFSDALTQKFMVLRGEQITTPLTVEQVHNTAHILCCHW